MFGFCLFVGIHFSNFFVKFVGHFVGLNSRFFFFFHAEEFLNQILNSHSVILFRQFFLEHKEFGELNYFDKIGKDKFHKLLLD